MKIHSAFPVKINNINFSSNLKSSCSRVLSYDSFSKTCSFSSSYQPVDNSYNSFLKCAKIVETVAMLS